MSIDIEQVGKFRKIKGKKRGMFHVKQNKEKASRKTIMFHVKQFLIPPSVFPSPRGKKRGILRESYGTAF